MCNNFDYEELIQNNLEDCCEDNLHLYFGKKRREQNETIYTFYETSTNEKVRKSLLEFFKDNLNNLTNDNITTITNEDGNEDYLKVNLEGIAVWNQFEDCVYTDISKFKDVDSKTRRTKKINHAKDLKKIKSNLNHYLLINESENCIYGQISRIKSSHVLYGKKWYFFEDEKFTEMKSQDNIELEERDSILFYIDKHHKFGFVNNIDEYDEIFDMNEQYESNAIEVINNSDFSNHCRDMDAVNRIVKNDRTIQKMLNRQLTIDAFENFDFDDIKLSFETFNNYEVEDQYDVEFENDEFLIDDENEKGSLRNIIKFIGGYYNQSLNGKYLIEGNPKHFITGSGG